MSDNQLLVLLALSLVMSFIFKFQNTTINIGRLLAGVESGTGFQNAITPPWYTNLSLFYYAYTTYTFYNIWSISGYASGLTAISIWFICATLIKVLIMNNISDKFFIKIITHSMMNRYADYSAKGDHTRAEAMLYMINKLR